METHRSRTLSESTTQKQFCACTLPRAAQFDLKSRIFEEEFVLDLPGKPLRMFHDPLDEDAFIVIHETKLYERKKLSIHRVQILKKRTLKSEEILANQISYRERISVEFDPVSMCLAVHTPETDEIYIVSTARPALKNPFRKLRLMTEIGRKFKMCFIDSNIYLFPKDHCETERMFRVDVDSGDRVSEGRIVEDPQQGAPRLENAVFISSTANYIFCLTQNGHHLNIWLFMVFAKSWIKTEFSMKCDNIDFAATTTRESIFLKFGSIPKFFEIRGFSVIATDFEIASDLRKLFDDLNKVSLQPNISTVMPGKPNYRLIVLRDLFKILETVGLA